MSDDPYHLTIRPGSRIEMRVGEVFLIREHVKVPVGALSQGARTALQCLLENGGTRAELASLAISVGGYAVIPELYLLLAQLGRLRLLCLSLITDGCRQATVVPLGTGTTSDTGPVDLGATFKLSRFCSLRAEGSALVAETPLSAYKVVIHDPRILTVIQSLISAADIPGLSQRTGVPEEHLRLLIALLGQAGIVGPADAPGSGEDGGPLRQWEFHDLYFHSRSRVGRHSNAYGGTYPYDSKEVPPPPAVKIGTSGRAVIELPKVDMAALERNDKPFAKVVADRRSNRKHHETAFISKAQLSEFLFRTCRVIQVFPPRPFELCSKPYPGGGSVYELEVYPLIDRCDGIDPGLYHYQGETHALGRVKDLTPEVRTLLDLAYATIAGESRPQILLLITARFGRISWKYRSVTYALILKHVGILYHNFYLAAAAMGLAPCALGGGDSDLFAKATGLDYFEEGAVGEFIIGTPQEGAKE